MNNVHLVYKLVIICLSGFLCMGSTELNTNYISKDEVESVVKEYIINHPQVMIDSLAQYQTSKQRLIVDKIHSFIKNNKQDLENINNNPHAGPPNASKTIIIFYDYNCGYCKSANDGLNHLLDTKKNIRIIYKPCSLLGDASNYLAKLSLAVYIKHPNKFKPIHDELMNSKHLTQEIVINIITTHGVDYKALELELNSKQVNNMLKDIATQSAQMLLKSVPTFVINDEIYSGTLRLDHLITLLDQ